MADDVDPLISQIQTIGFFSPRCLEKVLYLRRTFMDGEPVHKGATATQIPSPDGDAPRTGRLRQRTGGCVRQDKTGQSPVPALFAPRPPPSSLEFHTSIQQRPDSSFPYSQLPAQK